MLVIKRPAVLALSVSLVVLSALCWTPPVLAQGPRKDQTPRSGQALPGPSDDLLAKLESIYRDIHANPELSMQEQRTAGIAADWLRQYGYEVTEKIGGTGVVGLLRNGEGATVLLRADRCGRPCCRRSSASSMLRRPHRRRGNGRMAGTTRRPG